jgi:hypothetical protein
VEVQTKSRVCNACLKQIGNCYHLCCRCSKYSCLSCGQNYVLYDHSYTFCGVCSFLYKHQIKDTPRATPLPCANMLPDWMKTSTTCACCDCIIETAFSVCYYCEKQVCCWCYEVYSRWGVIHAVCRKCEVKFVSEEESKARIVMYNWDEAESKEQPPTSNDDTSDADGPTRNDLSLLEDSDTQDNSNGDTSRCSQSSSSC